MNQQLLEALRSTGLATLTRQDVKRYALRNRFIVAAGVVFFAPLVAGITRHTLFDDDCRARDLAAFVMSGSTEKLPDACQSVPLSMDATSVVIWFACWGSVLIFSRLTRQLERLDRDLRTTRLINEKQSVMKFTLTPRDTWPRLDGLSLALFVAPLPLLIWAGVEFHHFVRDSSPYFDFLATASTTHDADEFGDHWWAASGPAAWSWVAVGVTGAHFAIRHMIINFVFTSGLRRRPLSPTSNYRPNWEDPDHGWGPFESILLTIALGIFNFAMAFAAIVYLLLARTSQVGLTLVVLAAATVGIIGNYWAATSVVRYVRDSFGQARRRYARRLRRAQQSVPPTRPGDALLLAEQIRLLDQVGDFPLRGFWRHAAPLAIAIIGQLALVAATVRWLLTG